MAALIVLSYIAIRARYCETISREVTRFSVIARCMSEMVASRTSNRSAANTAHVEPAETAEIKMLRINLTLRTLRPLR
jgi:hypothetical protein